MSRDPSKYRGPVAWMASHPVAANLLMIALVVGGFYSALNIKQEVFPDFSLDVIGISIPYPGASPEETEKGILMVTEDAVRGIDGVKKITSTASEGRGSVSVELLASADIDRALQDVKNAVDRIVTYPEDVERPTVSLLENRNKVVTLGIFGPYSEKMLRDMAELVRDELSVREDVTITELGSSKGLEIAVEIPSEVLRNYGITPDEVARRIRSSAVEVPAGSLETEAGEVLIRTTERKDYGREFADIPIIAQSDGSVVLLGDMAKITDGFQDVNLDSQVNGMPAVTVDVYRVGSESPISISDAVTDYLAGLAPELPPGMQVEIIQDDSEAYRGRINLLLRNALLGLALVLLMLGLFLEPRLAFWVTLGIPISILGSFMFLSSTEASINMISLFAFIVTLGIIVDDAIVVGENIYEKREQGMPALDAAIAGARQISGPVTFAVLTNMVAFAPMLFVPGASGRLFLQIPAVAISVFLISLVESIFILPAHLSHSPRRTLFWRIVSWPSDYFSQAMRRFVKAVYAPVVRLATSAHYLTLSIAAGMLMLSISLVIGGRLPFTFLPAIDADFISVNARLPVGVPYERTLELQSRVATALDETIEELGGPKVIESIQSVTGGRISGGGPIARSSGTSTNVFGLRVELAPESDRNFSAGEFSRIWSERTGDLPGIESISFRSDFGRPSGSAIDVQLSHRDSEILDAASRSLAGSLRSFAGLSSIDSGVARGKVQLNYELTPEARSLGLDSMQLARQTRSYLYGTEALRQQRGRNEIRVMVRLPEDERTTLHTLENLLLRAPDGTEIPLPEAVEVTEGRAYTSIKRTDGRRVNSVTADIDTAVTNGNEVVLGLETEVMPKLSRQFPGLTWNFEGEQSEQWESLSSLWTGFGYAMFVIYALLAIAFRSWSQPLVVMSAIPFGMIGAVIGHLLMGYSMSLISLFGIVALSGVVVNDSLVLLVTTNEYRRKHPDWTAARVVCEAGARRFRPILLTSVTTFCGLLPMIFETSVQARFLIPMAISIAFGILFATFIILLIVPALYLALDDIIRFKRWILGGDSEEHRMKGGPLTS
ncbi:MAG: efflux RND transporter permease subunit [Planctomycetota bacterium]|nr:efflux RND transporter permease subunit [Planctomycetota bacterium]